MGARIKMSKPNDFYPGTNERICLITGGKDAIATIVHFLNTKIKASVNISTYIVDPRVKNAARELRIRFFSLRIWILLGL